MKVIAALVLLLLNVRLGQCCYGEGQILFCLDIPPAFRPGFSSLVMVLKDIGEINSTVFHSDDLVSITRLRIEGAGVTGIAEGAFRSLQNLIDLSLIQNLLTEVNPGWLSQPAVLSELRMTENNIETLTESMFNGLTGLTHLKLNRNRIREIHLNTFSSQNRLSELDLSNNKMTRVSPQVFRSLRSTRIRLDGNPWDCSCGARDFVNFLKDLLSRSLLDRSLDVTCESPSSVRGLPVWNVSVCETPPSQSPTSVMQSVKPKPTDFHQTSTPSSEKVTSLSTTSETVPMTTQSHSGTSPAGATLDTKPSNPPGPTDIPLTVTTSTLNPAAPGTTPQSVTDVSDHPKPFDPSRPVPTTTENHEKSSPSTTEISDQHKETCPSRPLRAANIVCTLPIVIVVLSFLLCTVCFLVVLHRRKRRDRCVMPEKENTPEESEISSVSSQSVYLSEEKENTEICATEAGWRSFSGVRAKSANALLFTSPFCVSVKHQPTIQIETQPKQIERSGNKGDIKRGIEVENSTEIAEVKSKQVTESRDLDESCCVSVHTDPVPYFCIGTNQNENIPSLFNHESSVNERSDIGKVMERTSTWPPTASQWQARYKMMKEEEKEGSDRFTVWTAKLPVERVKVLNPSHSEQETTEDATDKNPMDEPLKIDHTTINLGNSLSSELNDKTGSYTKSEDQERKAEVIQDLNPPRTPSQEELSHNQDLTLADEISNTSRSNKEAERRNDHTRAVTSRQRAGNRSSGSHAPSGGETPDDETLLSGNEYAFMDLLHEVVQNNGRWTRERWRQTHVNKQRR